MIIISLYPTRADIHQKYGVQTVLDTLPTGNLNGMDSQLLENMISLVLAMVLASSRLVVSDSLKLTMNSLLFNSVLAQNSTIHQEIYTMVLVGITSHTGMTE